MSIHINLIAFEENKYKGTFTRDGFNYNIIIKDENEGWTIDWEAGKPENKRREVEFEIVKHFNKLDLK